MAVTQSDQHPTSQQNAPSLQQPRSDLQPSGTVQQNTSSSQAEALPQDQLTTDQLRVGNSSTTVSNTTSTPPNYIMHQNYLNAAWLWMIVPVALAIVLFWPKKKQPANTTQKTKNAAPVVPSKRSKSKSKKRKKGTKR